MNRFSLTLLVVYALMVLGCASSRQQTTLTFPYDHTATIDGMTYTPGLIRFDDKAITVPACKTVRIEMVEDDGRSDLSVWADGKLVVAMTVSN